MTVTKFLEQAADDISVTKFMNMSQDPKLLQYLQQAEDDIAVTKYLYNMYLEATTEGDSAAQYLDTTVTKFLKSQQDDVAVTKYLGSTGRFLENDSNDISVTKFLGSRDASHYLNGPPEL